jgi:hypothetical protein
MRVLLELGSVLGSRRAQVSLCAGLLLGALACSSGRDASKPGDARDAAISGEGDGAGRGPSPASGAGAGSAAGAAGGIVGQAGASGGSGASGRGAGSGGGSGSAAGSTAEPGGDAGPDSGATPPPASGTFLALTYNVAGLPEGLSSSMPERFTPMIGPKLNG